MMADRFTSADRLISADDHVQEHPTVWTSRLSRAKWGDRIPHVERAAGIDRWMVDGQPLPIRGVADAGAVMADRSQEPQHWEEVPEAAYVPAQRLKAMDADGVDYSVLYPTVAGAGGETFGRIIDPDLELACVRAYNDWLIEEWASVNERFIPQCIVPLFPADAAVAEIERAVALGHRGVIYPAAPMELRKLPHVNEPDYNSIWAVCEALRVPLCIHAGSSSAIQIPPPATMSPGIAAAFRSLTRSTSTIAVFVNLLISRILIRHPNLKVVFAESTFGWGAYQVEYTDQQFREDGLHLEGYDIRPSEMFQRQCYLTGWYGRAGIETRRFIGVGNMMWSTNFPLATSTWPQSREYIDRCFAGVPEAERSQVLRGNAARLYRLRA